MTEHRSLTYGNPIPQDWLDAIQQFISTYLSPNAIVTVLNTNTVQVAATTDNGQIGIAINGRWRFNTAAVNATHPGGSAGTYNLWATASDNSFTIGPPEVDSTVYTFAIQILPVGNSPATALFRQIGSVMWNGTAITDANLLFDDPTVHGANVPGDLIFSANAARPGALLCDGSSYLRTTYPALFAALGGASSPYGFADGTHFNVPDFRGRSIIGVGTGTYSGASARALGGAGGEETHSLTAAESGVPAHTHPSGGAISGTTSGGVTSTGTTGTGTTGAGTTATSTTGTGTTGGGTTGTGTTGNDSPDHAHLSGAGNGFLDVTGVDGFVNITVGGGQFGYQLSTQGANTRHTHSVPGLSIPGLSVPGLSIPALTVAGLTIPGLSIPALTVPPLTLSGASDPSTPANSAAAASSAHNTMPPWGAAYIYIKT